MSLRILSSLLSSAEAHCPQPGRDDTCVDRAAPTAFVPVCSRSALKRPYYPSCILPGLLYLGDLEDAVAMPRLCETLNVTHAVTALAELPHSLQQSVSQSGVKHTWCNVRDVEEADIKETACSAFTEDMWNSSQEAAQGGQLGVSYNGPHLCRCLLPLGLCSCAVASPTGHSLRRAAH